MLQLFEILTVLIMIIWLTIHTQGYMFSLKFLKCQTSFFIHTIALYIFLLFFLLHSLTKN